ncbi:hypothetical protein [Methylobacterium sp. PvR107]|uniref:hypothetical protein n=1 Tax=Methylobacterium sp. PvR107 TaxID=2806597 RepID=UPI001B4854CD|nr:hypothetical protein [Methylobacterium sp. PvR107]MBP1178214.1 regulator of protease activity HflC (stomatin/prohibitin superfamily) [Methylobacterium sp. PvR107]
MSSLARIAVEPPAGPLGLRGGTPDPIDRVVALFSGPVPSAPAEGEDWSASLAAVRGVATRVRALQKSAQDSVRDARRAMRESDAAARASEDRARHAEGLLREAIGRAERAEEQARTAGERADRAEAQTTEARAWLRRMHECMVSEFGALTQDVSEP